VDLNLGSLTSYSVCAAKLDVRQGFVWCSLHKIRGVAPIGPDHHH
jgi:hypothetical protein